MRLALSSKLLIFSQPLNPFLPELRLRELFSSNKILAGRRLHWFPSKQRKPNIAFNEFFGSKWQLGAEKRHFFQSLFRSEILVEKAFRLVLLNATRVFLLKSKEQLLLMRLPNPIHFARHQHRWPWSRTRKWVGRRYSPLPWKRSFLYRTTASRPRAD